MTTEERQDKQAEKLESLSEQAKVTQAIVIDIHTRLFGNGQPGELDKLDARLKDQERTTNWAKGALAVITGALTLFGGTEIYHILTGKL